MADVCLFALEMLVAVSFAQGSALRRITVRLSYDEDAYPGGLDIGRAYGLGLAFSMFSFTV